MEEISKTKAARVVLVQVATLLSSAGHRVRALDMAVCGASPARAKEVALFRGVKLAAARHGGRAAVGGAIGARRRSDTASVATACQH